MDNRTVFYVIRHANAPKMEGQPDETRKLSEEGREKARKCGTELGKPNADLVLAPPCLRHRETAILVTGPENRAPTIIVPELFTPSGPDEKILNAAFNRFGYEPLGSYLDKGSNAEVQCLRRFGITSWAAVISATERHSPALRFYGGRDPFVKVVVIGSAIYIPAMLLAAASDLDEETKQAILDWNTPDCGVARLVYDNDQKKVLEITTETKTR